MEYVIKGVLKNVHNMPLYYPMQPFNGLLGFDGWYYGSLTVSHVKIVKNSLKVTS
jgi:hypothetical protein